MAREDYIPNMANESGTTNMVKQINSDLLRQSASKTLNVGITSLEIFRNKVSKRVKILDVKLSFSYQDKFQTETERLEKQLVRHGKKWSWPTEAGSKSLVNFPYCPGDRVNLNIGLIVHETKKHGLFGKNTTTDIVGNAAECIVLARNNGVGIGLPLNTVINQHIRLNFNLDGYGHHLTVKLKLEQLCEVKAEPSLWLRPAGGDKPFRSTQSLYDMLENTDSFPPRNKNSSVPDNMVRQRGFVCTNQRLVNYLRTAIIECWSFRPCCSESDIPSGIQVRQVSSNKPVACFIPVVEHRECRGKKHLRLALLIIGKKGPYCLCTIRWRSADKFDFKIHYYEKDETWGQRIKWASRDFLDIDHIIMNSTGHQYYFKPERDNPLMDLCVGLGLKFLVRWSDETMPWKRAGARELSSSDFEMCNSAEVSLHSSMSSSNLQSRLSSVSSLSGHLNNLPQFLESQNLLPFSDVESKLSNESCNFTPEPEEPRSRLQRRGSGSSYGESNPGSERYIKKEQKYRKKDLKKNTVENKNESDGDDFTSGFVDDFAGCSTGPRSNQGSYYGLESLID